MADIITALWLGSVLYSESSAAAFIGLETLPSTSSLLFAGLFTTLGFVIGNVGSSLASDAMFVRLLWPERYFHKRSFLRLAVMGLTTSATGPLQNTAHRIEKQFNRNRLFVGAEEGDMLGTAFFEDTKTTYKAFTNSEGRIILKFAEEARNNFWASVIALLPDKPLHSGKDEEKRHSNRRKYAKSRL